MLVHVSIWLNSEIAIIILLMSTFGWYFCFCWLRVPLWVLRKTQLDGYYVIVLHIIFRNLYDRCTDALERMFQDNKIARVFCSVRPDSMEIAAQQQL